MAGAIKFYKISLIQTFFKAVNLLSDIRRPQNQNSKIGPKIITSILPCFISIFWKRKQISLLKKLILDCNWTRLSTFVVELSVADIQHIETWYFDWKESIFWENDIYFQWFSMVRDRFSQIKTNSWISKNFLKYWILTKSVEI